MRSSEIGTAVCERAGGCLAECGRAIRRQRSDGDVLAVIVQPFLDVAACSRYFEYVVVVLEQDDVIGQPAEATQHHIFIAWKLFAGPKARLPFALQHRDI